MRSKIFLTAGGLALTTVAILAAIQLLSSRRNGSTSVRAATPLLLRANSADSQIQLTEARIAQFPSDPDGYNQLAAAFMQKGRETGV